ncbi:MAG: hypothetical protein L0322_20710, partial [Chloroflexi bacterium]|nr:hypothetical protein [Chloroflexota bacterium]MCI0647591.1 hypothetical protein [Chloroflexota bacterium]
MKTIGKILAGGFVLFLVALALIQPGPGAATAGATALDDPDPIQGPFTSAPVQPGLSPAVRDLPVAIDEPDHAPVIPSRRNPLANEPDQGQRGTWDRADVPVDPLVSRALG